MDVDQFDTGSYPIGAAARCTGLPAAPPANAVPGTGLPAAAGKAGDGHPQRGRSGRDGLVRMTWFAGPAATPPFAPVPAGTDVPVPSSVRASAPGP